MGKKNVTKLSKAAQKQAFDRQLITDKANNADLDEVQLAMTDKRSASSSDGNESGIQCR